MRLFAFVLSLLALAPTPAHAACLFLRNGRTCADLTEQCKPGCAPTSCAHRATGLITPNSPTQRTPFFQGAVRACRSSGTPQQVFECAWRSAVRAHPLLRTDQCTKDRLAIAFQSIAFNYETRNMTAAQQCSGPRDGRVPDGYYALNAPRRVFDASGPPTPAGEAFNRPPARNIGTNEGRLVDALRDVARVANPRGCALRHAASAFARGDDVFGRAYADLAVTGHRAFAAFRAAPPDAAYCTNVLRQPAARGCPPVQRGDIARTIQGCRTALTRAYQVANHLRIGQALPAALKTRARDALGWIAVSGEDDSPHRPVNVPSSSHPQFDVRVTVPTPRGRGRRVTVRSRYTIAQSRPPTPTLDIPNPGTWRLGRELTPNIRTPADVLVFVHGMDSRAEEAEHITELLFQRRAREQRNLVVIAVDLPSSGYADNLDYQVVSPLTDIGRPKLTPVPLPLAIPPAVAPLLPGVPPVVLPGVLIPDFGATGRTPVLDFIEEFIVRFVATLDGQLRIERDILAVMGGSLGGNMSFRLGRRPSTPWVRNVIVWSPASIWTSLAAGADLIKHQGPRGGWESSNDRDANDLDDRTAARSDRRRNFFATWDQPIVPLIVPMAQSDTWTSMFYPCHDSAIAGARLDRHETYDARFRLWHWRLGTEQLIYSHQGQYLRNDKPMLLACGTEDNVPFNSICDATQSTAPNMINTPGRAFFLTRTGHSVDHERGDFFADRIVEFLFGPRAALQPRPVPAPVANGQTCADDGACRSGRCDRGLGSQNTGRCIPNDGEGGRGVACNHNNQCRRNLTCTTPGPGRFGTCVANQSVADGQQCSHPSQCRSGHCASNRCRRQVGLCEPCNSNADCQNNRCDRGHGTQNTNVCIPNDGRGDDRDCCNHDNQCRAPRTCTTPRPGVLGTCVRNGSVADGQTCRTGAQCRSGRCTSNLCRGKAELRERCSRNSDCRSNVCDRGFGTQNTDRCIPANGQGRTNDPCNHNNQCRPGYHCTTPGPGRFGVCRR